MLPFIDDPYPYETPDDETMERVPYNPQKAIANDYCVLPDDDEMPF